MPQHSSFYVSPKGIAVCMTLTQVSEKQRILIELCAHLSLCGSERIGFIRWVFREEKDVWKLVLILIESLWIQNSPGAMLNALALAWMYTLAHMPRQSCVHGMLCVTASLLPSLEISCCIYSTRRVLNFKCLHRIWMYIPYIWYFLQWGRLNLTLSDTQFGKSFSETLLVISGIIPENSLTFGEMSRVCICSLVESKWED